MRRAFVLTVSDRSSRGEREDVSGERLAARLIDLRFRVERGLVPDDAAAIASAVRGQALRTDLVVVSGGTGIAPRDVTPQAILPLLDYEIPGIGEAMRAYGRANTRMADLSRSFGGVLGSALILAVPGSPAGALESLAAVEPLLDHALESLAGAARHAEESP
jgi:molybdenum cofactor synthesis domain-containing protein